MQESLLIVFYNVENLFPPDSPQSTLRSGLFSWDEKRYQNKIQKIAQVFHWITKEKKQLPTFIGLAEVATDSVMQDLISKMNNNYQFVHFDSLDERGIDTALIYDNTQMQLQNSQSISVVFDAENMEMESYDTTRDILECQFTSKNVESENWWIYVIHLPSKREKNINENKRISILKHLHSRLLEIKSENVDAKIVVMGDFNTNPNEALLLDFVNNENCLLENPFLQLFQNKHYTSYYHKNGMLFDQIVVSPSLKNQILETAVFCPQNLKVKSKKINHLPFRTYAGTRYQGGYSDHFPVMMHLKK